MFDESGLMRAAEPNQARNLLIDAKIQPFKELHHNGLNTTVLVDAIHMRSFRKDEGYDSVADKFFKNLLNDVPTDSSIIPFCCDRYRNLSFRGAE